MRAGAIAGSLRAFAAERAPLGAVAGLALALCAGPWALARAGGATLARASAVTCFVLFALRAVDDLCSLPTDRIAHPGRGLATGRIDAASLGIAAAVLCVGAVVAGGPLLAPWLAAVGLYYAAYYALGERVPVALRPALVNLVFLVIPLGVAQLAGVIAWPRGAAHDAGSGAVWLCVLFYWLAAVGHDLAHEVHGPDEAPPGPPTVSAAIGPRRAAALGLACYTAAAAAGALLAAAAHAAGAPVRLYVVGLSVGCLWVGTRLAALMSRPCRRSARRLYVSGFACFAVPSLLLGVDRLVGW